MPFAEEGFICKHSQNVSFLDKFTHRCALCLSQHQYIHLVIFISNNIFTFREITCIFLFLFIVKDKKKWFKSTNSRIDTADPYRSSSLVFCFILHSKPGNKTQSRNKLHQRVNRASIFQIISTY